MGRYMSQEAYTKDQGERSNRNSPVSLQDIRLDLEDPPITRSKRNIGIGIFISDLVTVFGVGRSGRLRRDGLIGIIVVVTISDAIPTEVDLVHSFEVCGSHRIYVVVERSKVI